MVGRRFLTASGFAVFVAIVNCCLAALLITKLSVIDRESMQRADLASSLQKLDALPDSIANAVLDAEYQQSRTAANGILPGTKTAADANALFDTLGTTNDESAVAKALSELNNWLIAGSDVAAVDAIRATQIERLRKMVVAKVSSLENQALRQVAARDGFRFHALAQSALAYYPADESAKSTAELRSLLSQQAIVASKLEALQRMRYNNWAASEIEKALKTHNRVRTLVPLKSNEPLIEAVGSILAPVDPAHLEPAAQSAYQYAVQKTMESLSDDSLRTKFATRLTKSDVVRIRLDQF